RVFVETLQYPQKLPERFYANRDRDRRLGRNESVNGGGRVRGKRPLAHFQQKGESGEERRGRRRGEFVEAVDYPQKLPERFYANRDRDRRLGRNDRLIGGATVPRKRPLSYFQEMGEAGAQRRARGLCVFVETLQYPQKLTGRFMPIATATAD